MSESESDRAARWARGYDAERARLEAAACRAQAERLRRGW
jgi:hypothetical protein